MCGEFELQRPAAWRWVLLCIRNALFFLPMSPTALERFLTSRLGQGDLHGPPRRHDSMHNVRRTLSRIVIFFSTTFTSSLAIAQVQEIQIQGRLTINAVLNDLESGRIVTGQLTDELGAPVMGTIQLRTSDDATQLALPIFPCTTQHGSVLNTQIEPDKISSADDGQFCVRTSSQGMLWAFAYSSYFQSAAAAVTQDQVRLKPPRFLSSPKTFDLHQEQPSFVEILASTDEAVDANQTASLELSITCNHQTVIVGEDTFHGSRLARFELRADSMTPGTCQLKATLKAAGLASVSTTNEVLIRSQVTLDVTDIQSSRTKTQVTVSAHSSALPSEIMEASGIIEARLGEHFVSSAPLSSTANAAFEFELTDREQDLRFKYIPANPAFTAGPDLQLTLPLRGQAFRWGVLHAIGLILFLAWLSYQWLRSNQLLESNPTPPHPQPNAHARKRTSGPIRGTVRDAHTQLPLPGVHVQLMRTTATQSLVVETASTDELGHFQFSLHFEASSLLSLGFTGDELMSLSTPVTAAEFDITMTGRRRAAVDELINWAKLRGHPWDSKPQATPGHVISVAQSTRQADLLSWAQRVERTSYGPSQPSEDQVRRLKDVTYDPHAVPAATDTPTLTTKI